MRTHAGFFFPARFDPEDAADTLLQASVIAFLTQAAVDTVALLVAISQLLEGPGADPGQFVLVTLALYVVYVAVDYLVLLLMIFSVRYGSYLLTGVQVAAIAVLTIWLVVQLLGRTEVLDVGETDILDVVGTLFAVLLGIPITLETYKLITRIRKREVRYMGWQV